MKAKRVSLLLLFALMLAIPSAVFADDDGHVPDFISADPNTGTMYVDMDQLTFTGTYEVPPGDGNPGMLVTIPGTEVSTCVGCMTFDMYTTADGQTVAMPTAFTTILIDATGQNPFGQEPVYALGGDALLAPALFGTLDSEWGISGGDAASTYANLYQYWLGLGPGGNPNGALADADSGGLDPFAMLKLNIALNLPGDPNNRGLTFVGGLFVGDLTTNCSSPACSNTSLRPVAGRRPPRRQPTPQPTARPTVQPTPVVNIVTVNCPLDPRVDQADPASTIQATKLSPNFPLVVGQDPEKTGVTLSLSMQVPPVYFSFNVLREYTDAACVWGGFGYNGDTCGGTASSEWYTSTTIVQKCERVTETYEDRLAVFNATADLSDGSIAWIEGELAAKYPGARVYQPNWSLFPGVCGGGSVGAASFSAQCSKIQIADPGKWIVNISGSTTGTKVSPPRGFSWSRQVFDVALMEVALTK
jgi:hypothetical protein